VKGSVDDRGRALIQVQIRNQPGGNAATITLWIDTAFDGYVVFPQLMIDQLKLASLNTTEAILADGSKVTLPTFSRYIDWFGTTIPLEVVANDGYHPLLGTALLDQRVLHIDYAQKQLTLD
jgi:clan AA aspartic protease